MNTHDAHRLYDKTRNLDGWGLGRTDRVTWAAFRFHLFLAECKLFKRYGIWRRLARE